MQGLDYTEQIHRIISHIILYAGFWRRQWRRQDLARRGAQNYMEIGLSKVTHTHIKWHDIPRVSKSDTVFILSTK